MDTSFPPNVRVRYRRSVLLVFLSFLSLFSLPSLSQDVPELSGLLTDYFTRQGLLSSEKVYLHTDKPSYASGDTVFLKGYLVDAVSHSPSVESNFICVELLDRRDSVLLRRKFKRTDGSFTGQLELPLTAQPGDYYLRGYTEWMRNAPPDYFFLKPLAVGNAIVTDIVPKVEYVENADGSRVMKLGFFNEEGSPYAREKVSYTLTDKTGRVYRRRSESTNASGVLYVRLDERSKLEDDPRVEVTFDADKYDYTRSFYVSAPAQNYAVSFFPEGGSLLAGQLQAVAFKAQNERGFGEAVSGAVISSSGTRWRAWRRCTTAWGSSF